MTRHGGRGDAERLVRDTVRDAGPSTDSAARQEGVADYFRRIGQLLDELTPDRGRSLTPEKDEAAGEIDRLPPRLRAVLDRLLQGDGEKQVTRALGLSQHTVHTYVREIYRAFGVGSRAQLLARFLGRGCPVKTSSSD